MFATLYRLMVNGDHEQDDDDGLMCAGAKRPFVVLAPCGSVLKYVHCVTVRNA